LKATAEKESKRINEPKTNYHQAAGHWFEPWWFHLEPSKKVTHLIA
jgi:hypothetical protein